MVNTSQIRGIIRLKVGLTLGFTLLMGFFGQAAALSGFLGGMIACLGSVVYAVIAYSNNPFMAPWVLIKRHFLAEGIKMGLTLSLFALTFILFRQIAWLAFLGGYMLTITAYWLGLVFKFGER